MQLALDCRHRAAWRPAKSFLLPGSLRLRLRLRLRLGLSTRIGRRRPTTSLAQAFMGVQSSTTQPSGQRR